LKKNEAKIQNADNQIYPNSLVYADGHSVHEKNMASRLLICYTFFMKVML